MGEVISREQYRKLVSEGKVRTKGKDIPGPQKIRNILTELKFPFVEEYAFDSHRKFRFDFANLNLKLAIEYEGTIARKSGHTTMTGYAKDCTKYNLAQLQGWRVLRYSALNMGELKADLLNVCNGFKPTIK